MFKLNTQTLQNTGEQLEAQQREYLRIRDELSDCLREIRNMTELSGEKERLKKVINKADDEIYLQGRLAETVIEIKNRYEKSDDLSEESAESCPRKYRQAVLGEVTIPVYESGVIKNIII